MTAILVAGAGTASASQTLLCGTTGCTEVYPAETAIAAELEEGTQLQLLTSIANVKCESSTIAGKTTAEEGEPLPLEVSELTFGECQTGGGKYSCAAVTTTTLPTSPSLEASGEGNGGTLSLEGGEVHFECPLVNCYYATPALQVKGGNPAGLSAEEVTMKKIKGFFCPAESLLDATYMVSEPKPAYAVTGRTFLCSTANCSEGAYPAETVLSASLEEGTRAKLLTSVGTVKCKSSSIAGKTTAEAGVPLPLEISELAFGECELEGKEACTATTESLPNLPYLAAGSEGNGTLDLTGGEVNFKCGFFIRCTYPMPVLQFEGGNPASFGVAEVELSGSGLICPETSKLHVTYMLSKPAPAFLVAM